MYKMQIKYPDKFYSFLDKFTEIFCGLIVGLLALTTCIFVPFVFCAFCNKKINIQNVLSQLDQLVRTYS